jgi:hypothetical protein
MEESASGFFAGVPLGVVSKFTKDFEKNMNANVGAGVVYNQGLAIQDGHIVGAARFYLAFYRKAR